MGAWVVAASSVAIPVKPNSTAISSAPGSQNPHTRPSNIPIDKPTNSVGVNTPPGAPEPLLASTASNLQMKIPLMTASKGGESKYDCTTL